MNNDQTRGQWPLTRPDHPQTRSSAAQRRSSPWACSGRWSFSTLSPGLGARCQREQAARHRTAGWWRRQQHLPGCTETEYEPLCRTENKMHNLMMVFLSGDVVQLLLRRHQIINPSKRFQRAHWFCQGAEVKRCSVRHNWKSQTTNVSPV